MATSGIYAIWHRDSGRCYVGSSANIERRWKEHRIRLKNGSHPNVHLLRAFRLYGISSLAFSILEQVDVTQLIAREQCWIDVLCPAFNHAPVAGSLLGFKRSEETKKRMSEAQRQRYAIKGNPLKGRARSPEARAAISAGKKGKTHSVSHRQNLGAALKGRISPRKGVILSKEIKAKISRSKTGIPLSEEHKARISEGQLRRYAANTVSGNS